MPKNYILLSVILPVLFFKAYAQPIPAPENAQMILEINTPALFKYVSHENFDKSSLSKTLMNKLLQQSVRYDLHKDDSIIGVKNYGIDLFQKSYVYRISTDSCTYQISLLPLQNRALFRDFIVTSSGTVNTTPYTGGSIYKTAKNSLAFLHNSYAILVQADRSYSFFTDNAAKKRYGIVDPYESAYQLGAGAAAYDEDSMDADTSAWDEADTAYEDATVADAEAATADSVVYNDIYEEDSTYGYNYDTYYQKLDSVSYLWAEQMLKKILTQNYYAEDRLRAMINYKPQPSNAVLSMYLRSSGFETGMLYNALFDFRKKASRLAVQNTDYIVGHLLVNDHDLEAKVTYNTAEENISLIKKIYNQKLNRKLFKYINQPNDLMVITSSINTENYLQSMPQFVAGYFKKSGSNIISAADIMADLISIIVDEKEISKLVHGDALLVINGLKKKQVQKINYTTNEENFDVKADTVMQDKVVPTFIAMFTTDREKIWGRWLQYAVRKGFVQENQSGIYSVKTGSGKWSKYLSLHFLIKNGIVFCASELSDAMKIKQGTYRGNISGKEKRKIRSHNINGWINTVRIIDMIKQDFTSSIKKEEDRVLVEKLKNIKQISFYLNGAEKNSIEGIYKMEMGEKYPENALEFLFNLAPLPNENEGPAKP